MPGSNPRTLSVHNRLAAFTDGMIHISLSGLVEQGGHNNQPPGNEEEYAPAEFWKGRG